MFLPMSLSSPSGNLQNKTGQFRCDIIPSHVAGGLCSELSRTWDYEPGRLGGEHVGLGCHRDPERTTTPRRNPEVGSRDRDARDPLTAVGHRFAGQTRSYRREGQQSKMCFYYIFFSRTVGKGLSQSLNGSFNVKR